MEMAAASSTSTVQQQLAHMDQHYPPPNQWTHTISFQSAGKKRKRMNGTSVEPVSPVSAASLYRDALHSIFKFLNLREFVRTCVINKSWYSAGQQMKTRKDELSYYYRPIFDVLVQSPLRHHITKLNLEGKPDPSSLLLLHDHMGHIEELTAIVSLTKDDVVKYSSLAVCFAIPKQLQSLVIAFFFWDGCDLAREKDVRTYLSGCMKQIAAQSTCLVKLNVAVYAAGVMDCPQELQTITTLTDIALPDIFNAEQQMDLIKSMPSIHRWYPTETLSPEFIQRLMDGSGPPPLLEDLHEFIEEGEEVNELLAEQLKRLVTLTKLDIYSMSLTDPNKLLPHFPHLTILNLGCEESVDVNHLVTALSKCVTLTELSLQHLDLTSLHIGQFLPHLTLLVELTFRYCVALVSLEFLSTASKSLAHLRSFRIHFSTQMPVNEYHHLRAISSSLEELTIENSSIGRFDPLMISRWTPGSKEFSDAEWPKLKSFTLEQ